LGIGSERRRPNVFEANLLASYLHQAKWVVLRATGVILDVVLDRIASKTCAVDAGPEAVEQKPGH
jgi:hypothetical protein